MNNLNFDICKKEIDSIKLSDQQKDFLIELMQKESQKSKITDITSVKSGYKEIPRQKTKKSSKAYVKWLMLAASFVVLFTILFIFIKVPSSQNSLQNFQISVALADNTDTQEKKSDISENDTIIEIPDDTITQSAGKIKISLLDLHIKGENVDNVDISSERGNFITCTRRESPDDIKTEINRTSYKNLSLVKISCLGWMPSYDNILLAKEKAEKASESHQLLSIYKEYLSDIIDVTLRLKDGSIYEKKISISYDQDLNYVIKYVDNSQGSNQE